MRRMGMAEKFEMNGKAYATDKETLEVIRSLIPTAKASSDFSAVAAVMIFGQKTGRVREIA